MINAINYINVKEALSRVLQHPLLQDVTLEQGIRYALDFLNIVGFSAMYEEKIAELEVEDFATDLPTDYIRMNQVMDSKSGIALRLMTDSFLQKKIPQQPSYKIQGRKLYTSFRKGNITLSYYAVMTDCEGFPMIPDLPIFLKALELYIKLQAFTILFDLQKIPQAILQNVQQEYSWAVAQLSSQMTIPSVDEMENITNMLNQQIPSMHEHRRGFIHLGEQTIL